MFKNGKTHQCFSILTQIECKRPQSVSIFKANNMIQTPFKLVQYFQRYTVYKLLNQRKGKAVPLLSVSVYTEQKKKIGM